MFHVGQKVVCVDSGWLLSERLNPVNAEMLTEGDTYTVAAVRIAVGIVGIQVAEVVSQNTWGFLAVRFRPAVERKTDISIFTEMLTPKTEKVTA